MATSIHPIIDRLASLFKEVPSSQVLLVGASTVTLLGLIWIVRDKQGWVEYGTGGTPPTWSGYFRNNIKLRYLRATSGDDLADHTKLNTASSPHFLANSLPIRGGERPAMNRWTLPQRQRAQPESLDTEALERLHAITASFHSQHSDVLTRDLSITEGKTTPAIYAKPGLPGRHHTAKDAIIGDEIAHVHPQDASLHVWLSEADCAEVVRKGWGLRFPLSSLGLCHPSQTFVYAPRNMEEVEVVEQIVRAGIKYLTGKTV